MNHKRHRPKSRRGGCPYKPHKHQNARLADRDPAAARRRLAEPVDVPDPDAEAREVRHCDLLYDLDEYDYDHDCIPDWYEPLQPLFTLIERAVVR